MANDYPCNKQPIKYISCYQVMDCINIKSSNNSISIAINECGIDLTLKGNNLDEILQINDGDCVQMVKEFIDGKLVITPVVDFECVAENVCELCNPITCPTPIELVVSSV